MSESRGVGLVDLYRINPNASMVARKEASTQNSSRNSLVEEHVDFYNFENLFSQFIFHCIIMFVDQGGLFP